MNPFSGKLTKARVIVASLLVAGGGALVLKPLVAEAHHNTITCVAPGVVNVANSEGISQTFTTDDAADSPNAGSIPGNGSVNITYTEPSITVFGVWSNGVTNTASFTGICVDETTTVPETTMVETTLVETTIVETTEPETTVVETTEPVETTIVETTEPTETTEPVETTEPTDTTEPEETTSTSTSTTLAPTTTAPATSIATTSTSTIPIGTTTTEAPTPTTGPVPPTPPTSTTTPDTTPVCEPVLIDLNRDGDFDDPNENSCQTGDLPETA